MKITKSSFGIMFMLGIIVFINFYCLNKGNACDPDIQKTHQSNIYSNQKSSKNVNINLSYNNDQSTKTAKLISEVWSDKVLESLKNLPNQPWYFTEIKGKGIIKVIGISNDPDMINGNMPGFDYISLKYLIGDKTIFREDLAYKQKSHDWLYLVYHGSLLFSSAYRTSEIKYLPLSKHFPLEHKVLVAKQLRDFFLVINAQGVENIAYDNQSVRTIKFQIDYSNYDIRGGKIITEWWSPDLGLIAFEMPGGDKYIRKIMSEKQYNEIVKNNLKLPLIWDGEFFNNLKFVKKESMFYKTEDGKNIIEITIEENVEANLSDDFKSTHELNFYFINEKIKNPYLFKTLRYIPRRNWIYLERDYLLNIQAESRFVFYLPTVPILCTNFDYIFLIDSDKWESIYVNSLKKLFDNRFIVQVISIDDIKCEDNKTTKTLKLKLANCSLNGPEENYYYEWWSPHSGLVAIETPDGKMYIRSKKLEEEEKMKNRD